MYERRLRGRYVAPLVVAAFLAGACAAERDAPSAGVTVSAVYVAEPILGERAAMYFSVDNQSETDDSLLSVATPAAGRVEIHRTVRSGDAARMEPIDSLPVPAGSTVRLAPGGHHAMLLGLRGSLSAGDTVAVTLTFRDAGAVQVQAIVVSYADLEETLEGGPGPAGDRGAHEGHGTR